MNKNKVDGITSYLKLSKRHNNEPAPPYTNIFAFKF